MLENREHKHLHRAMRLSKDISFKFRVLRRAPMLKSKFLFLLSLTLLVSATAAIAQVRPPVPRPSQKATISQTIGTTEVSVAYSRPAVKGRKIYGEWPTPVAGEATLDNQNQRPQGTIGAPAGLWFWLSSVASPATGVGQSPYILRPFTAGRL